ncbi:putative zinc-binding metallopeptidase [uncultured Bacteroides sp.]|uniref:zinc-binding metallopeptidase n=1 Tax=uncultured Bacteroides sp. TaxID=162156 RepID=UPI00267693E6|nr:putative zinc-binding metallopeptidase [uncultured Bacteroides sp.]
MKKNTLFLYILFFITTLCSCSEEELNSTSIFDDVVEYEKNELDLWLDQNYLYTYNVDFKYRMEDIESSLNNNLVPIEYNMAVKMARAVKYLWFEAYDEAGGINFTRQFAPKIIHVIGSWQWNTNGTYTLGYAEGGLKVTLVGGNWLNPNDIADMNERYFKTMHHEFAHILHQTKNYPTEYNELSEGHYSPSGWNNRSNMSDYAPYGFVTAYGSSEPGEDIAEVTACYLTWTDDQWDTLQAGAGEEGWAIIQRKIEIMKKYMTDSYNIDMDYLREIIDRRGVEIQAMDLTELP